MTEGVTIYTDGACRGNPGPGGWGAWLIWGEHEKALCGGEPATTNNRMELTAAIRSLEALKRRCRITLYTDSVYLRDGITRWLSGWKARGWKTAAKKPVANQDLWEALDTLVQQHDI
ncbi:MAG: ribonuclease HI, partial [Pseudomonadota bacterium]